MELHDYINQRNPDHHTAVVSRMGTCYRDQYPYSPEDSFLWLELFTIASLANHELAQRLVIIRAVGASLILNAQYGFIIEPIIDPSGFKGWHSIEEYNYEKQQQNLNYYAPQLLNSLAELRRRYNNNLIYRGG